MSNSQNNEEDVLLDHFAGKPTGRLLDVGAWSGKALSNSYALLASGWSGVCVEPSPGPFLELAKLYAGRPDVTLVNVAVAPEAGLAEWFDCGGDAVSTLNAAHRDKWAGAAQFRKWLVATVTPGQLCERVGFDVDLLSLDVEGNSASLLTHFPIAKMPRLACVVVEHDSQVEALSAFLGPFGFGLQSSNSENALYFR